MKDKCEHLYITEKSPKQIHGELIQLGDTTYYTFKVPALYSKVAFVCDSCGEELEIEVESY